MHRILSKKIVYDAIVCLALLVAVLALIIYPQESIDGARNGLTLCANVIIPSLFPFFILSTLVVETGITRYLGKLLEPVMRPLFNVNGACAAAFALGFVGGYPIGAKAVISLYENGSCGKTEAERLLSFCNNSGPAFIFGVVGAGVFSSSGIGLLLYLVHMAASVCVGLVFRNWRKKQPEIKRRREGAAAAYSFPAAFTNSVKSSVLSMLNICGFVIFFTVFIRLLFISGFIPALAGFLGILLRPLGFDSSWAERLLTGAIEISSGVWSLKNAPGLTGSIAMAAVMLGWAGLSVHCQVLSFIGTSGLSVKTYLIGKLMQAAISAVFVLILAEFFIFKAPAVYLAEQVTVIASQRFFTAGAISTASSALLFGLFVLGAKKAASRGGRLGG